MAAAAQPQRRDAAADPRPHPPLLLPLSRNGSRPSPRAGPTLSPNSSAWTPVREGWWGRREGATAAACCRPRHLPLPVPPPRKLPGDPELPDEDEELEKQEKPSVRERRDTGGGVERALLIHPPTPLSPPCPSETLP